MLSVSQKQVRFECQPDSIIPSGCDENNEKKWYSRKELQVFANEIRLKAVSPSRFEGQMEHQAIIRDDDKEEYEEGANDDDDTGLDAYLDATRWIRQMTVARIVVQGHQRLSQITPSHHHPLIESSKIAADSSLFLARIASQLSRLSCVSAHERAIETYCSTYPELAMESSPQHWRKYTSQVQRKNEQRRLWQEKHIRQRQQEVERNLLREQQGEHPQHHQLSSQVFFNQNAVGRPVSLTPPIIPQIPLETTTMPTTMRNPSSHFQRKRHADSSSTLTSRAAKKSRSDK